MKNILLTSALLLLFCISSNAQLTGITPNQGTHGQTLQTTITGNSIFIQSGSPSGNLFDIKLKKGTDIINVFDFINFGWNFNVTVTGPNTVDAEVIIPPTIPDGVYDLEVITGDVNDPWWNQTTYTLPAAFTVLPPDGYATGTVYEDLNKNGIKDGGEPGLAGRTLKLLPLNYTLNTDVNGNYSFPLFNGSYSITILNNTSDYMFSTSSDTMAVIINNNTVPGNDFGLKRALVSVTSDTAYVGATSVHQFVADEPIFIPGANPYGNITQVRVFSSPNIYPNYTTSVNIINSTTVDITITVPTNTLVADSVDIYIYTVSGANGYHYLRKKFNIGPPDGYITGMVYRDSNRNGIQDAGETGIAGQTIKLLPSNATVNTDVNGNYSFAGSNGNYSVTVLSSINENLYVSSPDDTLAATINNNTSAGNNFGLKTAMYSITPNFGYKGITTVHQIVADEPIFFPGGPPNGNVSQMRIYSSPNINLTTSSTVTVIDSFTIQVSILVPTNTAVGSNIDLRIYLNAGRIGYHHLRQALSIAVPPYYISGNMFFDSNQNKIKDAGEPGIQGAKATLTPDNTIAFSDAAGNYLLGSAGGIQTLTPGNNISGLLLFTDSATYTMNVNSNITGKNFGYISSEPDYSILVKDLYLFARCNTNQYVKFKVKNNSNIPYNAVAWLKASSNMTYVSALIPPSSISNDTIYWNITNLAPYSEIAFDALYSLPGGGNVVNFSAGAYSMNAIGVPQLSEVWHKEYPVFCAWDPNDKAVTPEGITPLHYTLMSDTLRYLIRFQNTGNDTAFKVVILDTLDMNLDFNTFEILGSSHSMLTEIKSSGAVTFTFNNILLPDSNVNEPGSHGYISYSIRPQSGLPDNTPVNNTAHIFFDFNPDVVTNTTLNTLVYVLSTGGIENENDKANVVFYPNPFNQSATLLFDNPKLEDYKLTITSTTGQIAIPVQHTSGNMFVIEKNQLAKGVYFYSLMNITTNKTYKGKMMVKE